MIALSLCTRMQDTGTRVGAEASLLVPPGGSLLLILPALSSAGSGVPATRAAHTQLTMSHSCLTGMKCTSYLGDTGGQETGLLSHSWGPREPLAPPRWRLEKDSDCQEITPQQKW